MWNRFMQVADRLLLTYPSLSQSAAVTTIGNYVNGVMMSICVAVEGCLSSNSSPAPSSPSSSMSLADLTPICEKITLQQGLFLQNAARFLSSILFGGSKDSTSTITQDGLTDNAHSNSPLISSQQTLPQVRISSSRNKDFDLTSSLDRRFL